MTTAGICMVKDEADIIEATIRHMLTQVDYVFVLDNNSTDDTFTILSHLEEDAQVGTASRRLRVTHDPEVGYYQSQKMSALAARASREVGADWVVPFDADEVWYSPFGRIGDVLARLDPDTAIARATLYNHYATGADLSGHPFNSMAWRSPDPGALPKVAARVSRPVIIEQGNHGADYPPTGWVEGNLVVRHFPYRSAEQMIRKARNGGRAYAATNLPSHIGEHWRSYDRMCDEDIAEWFRQHFWYADPTASGLIYDPAPEAVRAAG